MRLVAAFAVALAWAGLAVADPPPVIGWQGVLNQSGMMCVTPDQLAIFVEAHNAPNSPVEVQAMRLLIEPPAQCALIKPLSPIKVMDVVRLPAWDMGRGFSWPAYALQIGDDAPVAWFLYLDTNPMLGG